MVRFSNRLLEKLIIRSIKLLCSLLYGISYFYYNSSANDYMNKRLWNTIILDGSIPQGEIERMMDNSYMLVVSKMTKKDQQSILLHIGS
ncbi:hypothetical protein CXF79_03065 [Colwellia sp. Bg11-28]|nr:hypothetical protein CXF79_03065 [Colwellia sp. Bg11-28]